jgi:glycyl-tRNA synthetase beta chain
VDFSQLTQEGPESEPYLVYNQTIAGRTAQDVLPELLPDLLLGLSGSHFMFWGTSTIKFSRPIRWLVSVWNDQPLPLEIGTVRSDVYSRGHRILAQEPVRIASVGSYVDALKDQGKVIVDQAARRDLIRHALAEAAKPLGGVVPENEDLLDTVTRLVEYPSVVVGRFEERFLDIPKEVIVTVMAAHQKYFPVQRSADPDSELLPYFLAVANGRVEAHETIRAGNERVLTARLEDARFFFDEDRKTRLENRVEALKGVMFQKGMGSMYDKTQRLSALSGIVAEALKLTADQVAHAKRGALLAKTDLMTGMVRELTELQGVMGRKYAQLEGEPQDVCEAIFEQYLPRFTGDAVPTNPAGMAVSLADKADTLVAVFSQKNARLPSGSKDPLGLRRMAAGMIQTVLDNGLRLDITQLLSQAYDHLGALATAPKEQSLELVQTFILQRLRAALLEQNIRYDVIDAVLESANPLSDLVDTMERLEQIKTLSQDAETLKRLYEPANRIGRILGEAYRSDVTMADLDAARFKDPSEQALFDGIKAIDSQLPYPQLIQALSGLYPSVETFFNQVLINDPDERIKENRYNLLSLLNRLYLRLARFAKLVV